MTTDIDSPAIDINVSGNAEQAFQNIGRLLEQNNLFMTTFLDKLTQSGVEIGNLSRNIKQMNTAVAGISAENDAKIKMLENQYRAQDNIQKARQQIVTQRAAQTIQQGQNAEKFNSIVSSDSIVPSLRSATSLKDLKLIEKAAEAREARLKDELSEEIRKKEAAVQRKKDLGRSASTIQKAEKAVRDADAAYVQALQVMANERTQLADAMKAYKPTVVPKPKPILSITKQIEAQKYGDFYSQKPYAPLTYELNQDAKYAKQTRDAAETQRRQNRLASGTVFDTRSSGAYAGKSKEELQLAKIAVQEQIGDLHDLNAVSQFTDRTRLAEGQKVLILLTEELALVNKLIGQEQQLAQLRNGTVHQKQQEIARERNLIRSEQMNPDSLRGTSNLSSIRGMTDPTSLSLARSNVQREINDALRMKRQLETTGDDTSQIQRKVTMYHAELAALNEINHTLATQDNMKRRLNTLTTPQGLGGMLAIQALISKNYMLLNGFQNLLMGTFQFLKDYEAGLATVQAISQSTTSQMVELKNAIAEVANESKFGGIELAKSAETLAQAGFSVNEVKDSLRSVALLAVATGSSLETTTQIAVATLGAFQLSASNLPTIVNELTQAMNLSQLDMTKFSEAIQYAGNAANDSGIDFKEMLATIATASNTGIKSGSTLGTGYRQLMADLTTPTEKFKAVLAELGLTQADVDIKTHGLIGALHNLKDAGFSTSDAYKSLEVRAVAFYQAVSNNLGAYDDLSKNLDSGGAAAEANATQMDTLASQSARVTSEFQLLANNAGGAFSSSLKELASLTADLLHGLKSLTDDGLGGAISQTLLMTAALAGTGVGLKLTWSTLVGLKDVLRMFSGATKVATAAELESMAATVLSTGATARQTVGLATHQAALSAETAAILQYKTAQNEATLAAERFNKTAIWLTVGIAAISLAVAAYDKWGDSAEKAAEKVETSKTALNNLKDSVHSTGESIGEADNKIIQLNTRFEQLSKHPELISGEFDNLRNKAVELGIGLKSDLTGNVEDLISAWKELRQELAKKLEIDSAGVAAAIITARDALADKQKLQEEGGFVEKRNRATMGNDKVGQLTGDTDFNKIQQGFFGRNLNPVKSKNYTQAEYNQKEIDALMNIKGAEGDASFRQAAVATQGALGNPRGLGSDNAAVVDILDKNLPALSAGLRKTIAALSKQVEDYKVDPSKHPEFKDSDRLLELYKASDAAIRSRIDARKVYFSQTKQAEAADKTAAINKATTIVGGDAYLKGSKWADTFSEMSQSKEWKTENARTPADSKQWNQALGIITSLYGKDNKGKVPREVLEAILLTETNGVQTRADGSTVKSEAGALGIGQLMPATAKRFGVGNINDMGQNIAGSKAYLEWLWTHFGGDLKKVVASYNAGEGAVEDKNAATDYKETRNYTARVLKTMYKGQLGLGNSEEIVGDQELSPQLAKSRDRLIGFKEALTKSADEATTTAINLQIDHEQEIFNNLAEADNKKNQALLDAGKNLAKTAVANADFVVQQFQDQIKESPDADFFNVKQKQFDSLREAIKNQARVKLSSDIQGAEKTNGGVLTADSEELKRINTDNQRELDKQLANVTKQEIEARDKWVKEQQRKNLAIIDAGAKELQQAKSKMDEDAKIAKAQTDLRIELDKRLREAKTLTPLRERAEFMQRANQKNNFTSGDINQAKEAIDKEADNQDRITAIARATQDLTDAIKSETDARALQNKVKLDQIDLDAKIQAALAGNVNPEDPILVKNQAVFAANKKLEADYEVTIAKAKIDQANATQSLKVNDPNYKQESGGIWKSLQSKVDKDLTDLISTKGRDGQALEVLGGFQNAFTGFQESILAAGQASGNFWKNLIGDTKNGENAFSKFGLSVLQTMQKVVMDEMTKRFTLALMGSGKDGNNGWLGTAVNGLVSLGSSLFGSTPNVSEGFTPSGFNTAGVSSGISEGMGSIRMASGGSVVGGTPYMDSVPILGMQGEYMLPKTTVDAVGTSFLNDLRSNPEATMAREANQRMTAAPAAPSKPSMTNVYVVSPDNVPATLNPNDVVAAVADDIQRDGSIKRLIKSVQAGN